MGSPAGRFGRSFRQLRNAPSTWLLFRLLVLIQAVPFVWDLVSPPPHSHPDKLTQLQIMLGLRKDHFLAGDFWQILSHALIHGNWLHLLLNAACLVILGAKLEHIIGKRSLWLLALYSTLAGGLLFLLLTPTAPPALLFGEDQPPTLVGSSAICFGFLVFLTTLSPESKFLPVFVSGRLIGLGIILVNLILALLNPDLPTGPLAEAGRYLSDQGFHDGFKVSHACHLGGSLAGLFYAKWLLRPRVTLAKLQKARQKKEKA
jgi:membrane associated rhomboid family serine protease